MRKERPVKAAEAPSYKKALLAVARKESAMVRVERPTNLQRARALGYRAKQGFCIVRVRIKKGGRDRPTIQHGRKPSKFGKLRYTTKLSKRSIAEQRVADIYPNLEVLNSYEIITDGAHKWYEVILVDPNHPSIIADPKINWICSQTSRAYRGLTSSMKKNRGLRNKGKGAEHVRPSVRVGKHV